MRNRLPGRLNPTPLLCLAFGVLASACGDSAEPPEPAVRADAGGPLDGGTEADAGAPSELDVTPPPAATGPVLVPGTGGIATELGWTLPASDDLAGAIVLRAPDQAPDTAPSDGAPYVVGDVLGSAVVVQLTDAVTNATTDAAPAGAWCWAVHTHDEALNYSAALDLGCANIDAVLPVENLSVAPGEAELVLTWDEPSDPALDRVVIRRGLGTTPDAPSAGDAVCDPCTSPHSDPGLLNGVEYTYAAWAVDGSGGRSTAAVATGTPVDTAAPDPVTDFRAVSGNGQIRLSWTEPADADLSHVVIRRSEMATPTSPTDGVSVCDPCVSGHIDSGLMNGTRYFYSAFALDVAGNVSPAEPAEGTPSQLWVGASGTQQAAVRADTFGASDQFGYAVAVDGDTMVVGAPLEDGSAASTTGAPNDNASDAGAAYVFTRSGSTWTPQAYLKGSDAEAGDWFGASVAISGDTVVIGARTADAGADDAGAAYVFTRSGTSWSEQAILEAPDPGAGDWFGASVAISGDIVVVGARQADGVGPDSGAAYVFTRSGGSWGQPITLEASNAGAGDWFGHSVAVSGDTIVVGAQRADGAAANAGAAYVFGRSGSDWTEAAILEASNAGADDWFGFSVGISGDAIVVGAPLEDTTGRNSGAAYVFSRSGGSWSEEAILKASNAGVDDWAGWSVGISADAVVVGASQEDDPVADAGAAYVFTRSGNTWTEAANLEASNAGSEDEFGFAVGISADTVVVGARFEDDAAFDAGAAYVFVP